MSLVARINAGCVAIFVLGLVCTADAAVGDALGSMRRPDADAHPLRRVGRT